MEADFTEKETEAVEVLNVWQKAHRERVVKLRFEQGCLTSESKLPWCHISCLWKPEFTL